MKILSNETKFMNYLISLSIKNEHCDPKLFNEGYQLEKIEPHFTDRDGKVINPDIQLKSHEDKNLLFFEIKCGAIEHEQALRYKNLQKQDIIDKGATSLDLTKGDFEFIYVCDKDSLDKLKTGDDKNNYGFTILCAYKKQILNERDKIRGRTLKKIFSSPVDIPEHPPTEYYPYGLDDKVAYISLYVLQSILGFMGKGNIEFNEDEIIKDTHPIIYDLLDKQGKGKLKRKIKMILDDLDQNEFKDYIKKLKYPQPRYRINPKTMRKFRDLCQQQIDKYEQQIPQTTFEEF